MLIGQQVLDNAYFPHCYYYGHLLSIMKIYKPEDMPSKTKYNWLIYV